MNSKGIQTTIVAIIVALIGITIFVLWFLGELDNSQLTLGLASVATFGTTIGLWLAKDSNKSHTTDNKPNSIPGGGLPKPKG